MRTLLTRSLIALAVLACSWTGAQAGWGGVRIGIGIGVPFPYYGYGPYYRPYYYGYPYYGPAVVVAAPAPAVVVQTAPVLQTAPAGSAYPPAPPPPTLPAPTPISAAPAPQSSPPPPLAPVVARSSAPDLPSDTDHLLQLLHDQGEGARISAVMQLGRGKIQQAVEPLTQVLNNDTSPRVRDAAARALGLIASPSSLNTLQTAAQADDDREVRHSAQFAAEVIRSNLRR
jgi:HEAT repeat protein